MPSSVLFRLVPDPVITEVMATFVDLSRRPVPGPITVEELLLHLLEQPETRRICVQHHVHLEQIKGDADQALLEAIQTQPSGLDTDPYAVPLPLGEFPQRTEAFEAVVIDAITQAQCRPGATVGVLDFLVAISHLPRSESLASRVLHDHGLTARLLTLHASRQPGSTPHKVRSPADRTTPGPDATAPAHRDGFVYDLGAEASDELERQHLVEEAFRLLAGARQPNLLLVGPSGSGKTSVARELARRLAQGPWPSGLTHTRILGLNIDALAAGCQIRGQMEERLRKHVLSLLETRRQPHESVLLWLGDLGHVLTYARKDMDVLLALRQGLREGYVRLMASATPEQLKRLQDHDPDMAAQFVQLQVRAPSVQETQVIAQRHVGAYAEHHAVAYPATCVAQAQALVARYLPQRPPITALLQVLDEAGAHARHQHRSTLTDPDLHAAIARQAQVAPEVVAGGDAGRVLQAERHLRAHLVGQDAAIEVVMDTLRRATVGLGEGGRTRPVGSFFFAGGTGVGKTETALRLAEGLGVPLVRLDMSEFAEPHSIARLIGAPPGYVGHTEVPILAKALEQSPRSVLLVDEIEKAHPAVHMLFLQILSQGTLTDGKGQPMDFRQCVIISTSNIGTQEAERRSIGFQHDPAGATQRREAALALGFPPEFRNRFDHIIQFKALTPADMAGVVDRTLARLARQVGERGHQVRFAPSVRAHLAEQGFDPQMGARPLQRLVDREVGKVLTDELLRATGPLRLSVVYRSGKLQVRRLP